MAKKRKRRKKNKKTDDLSFIDEIENPPLARGEEIIGDGLQVQGSGKESRTLASSQRAHAS